MRTLLRLALLVCPLVASAQWVQTQTAKQAEATYSANVSVTLTATHAGSTLVLVTANMGQGDQYSGVRVTDNKGSTWQLAITKPDTASFEVASIWYLTNAPAGITTVTAQPTGGTSGPALVYLAVEEWTPPAGTVSLDVTNAAIAAIPPGNAVSAGVVTTGNDIVIAGGIIPGIGTVSSPFTMDAKNLNTTTNRGEGIVSTVAPTSANLRPNITGSSASFMPDAIEVVASFGIGATGGGVSGGGNITLSGCNTDVVGGRTTEGTPCTITSSSSGTNFALAGIGSLSCTTNCTSTVYTPPSSGVTTHMRFGCPAAPPDSIFNTRVDNLPIHPNNTTWVSSLSPLPTLNPLPAWGVNIVDNSTPTTAYNYHYTTTFNGIGIPNIDPTQSFREGGGYDYGDTNDHHSVRLNKNTCTYYDLYGEYLMHSFRTSGLPNATAASTYIYNGASYALPTDGGGATDAAGMPLTPTMITADDVRNGLKHMSRMTLCPGCISSLAHYWPATQSNGSASSTSLVPSNGSIARLKATYDCTHAGAASLFYQNVCNGWKQYGVVISDNGNNSAILFDPDVQRDPAVSAAMVELYTTYPIPQSQLEWLDVADSAHGGVGSLIVSSISSQVKPDNGFVVPSNYAMVTASKGAAQAQMPIAVQPIGIGMLWQQYIVTAGSAAYQLSWWVEGTANQSVTWVHTSGPGTVTSGGLYTPPGTLASRQTDILTGTAAADSTAKITVIITVDPPQPSSSILRVDIGGSGCAVGVNGCTNQWVADYNGTGFNVAGSFAHADTFPRTWSTTGLTDWFTWQTAYTNYNFAYGPFIVPNGNYQVTFMVGFQGQNGGTQSPTALQTNFLSWGATVPTANHVSVGAVDFGLLAAPSSYFIRQGNQFTLPVTVTDNLLLVRLNGYGVSGQFGTEPYLSGFVIAADSATTPRWDIWSGQRTSLSPGQLANFNCQYNPPQTMPGSEIRRAGTLQLSVLDWFTGANNPTWSVVSGPGSMETSGCYVAPASVSRTTPVTIQASNGTTTATKTIYILGTAQQAAIR